MDTGQSRRASLMDATAEHDMDDNAQSRIASYGGRVRIAPRALRTVVCESALSVPGVARLYTPSRGWVSTLARPLPRAGVALLVRANTLGADLYVVVTAGANMVEVGEAIQAAVATSIEHILGMDVSAINVYIRDVD